MNESQKNRIAPYVEAMKLWKSSGQWIEGRTALNIMNDINVELGNMPTMFNCGACINELLRMTYNNYYNGK